IKTVEEVIGITVQDYKSLIERSGNEGIVFRAEDCCINSGAVYAFNFRYLSKILKDNQTTLSEHGWPATAVDFIRRIAAEWVDEGSPVMPVIRKAFGDALF